MEVERSGAAAAAAVAVAVVVEAMAPMDFVRSGPVEVDGEGSFGQQERRPVEVDGQAEEGQERAQEQ